MKMLLLHCVSPELALFVESLQRSNSGAIGGTADMPRTRRARRSDAFDPKPPIGIQIRCDAQHSSHVVGCDLGLRGHT
jgi:hypothetical protein